MHYGSQAASQAASQGGAMREMVRQAIEAKRRLLPSGQSSDDDAWLPWQSLGFCAHGLGLGGRRSVLFVEGGRLKRAYKTVLISSLLDQENMWAENGFIRIGLISSTVKEQDDGMLVIPALWRTLPTKHDSSTSDRSDEHMRH